MICQTEKLPHARIVIEQPPLIQEIRRRFPIKGRGVIFAWGDRIYNPENVEIPPHLVVHELEHMRRQRAFGVEDWWLTYLVSRDFRLDEELAAHRVEYRYLVDNAGSRQERRRALRDVAARLRSPLYRLRLARGAAEQKILGEVAA